MQTKSASLIQVLTLIFLCNTACTKKNTPAPTSPPAPTKDIPVLPTPVTQNPHFPAKLESDNLLVTFKYSGTSGNVTEIESSDGKKEIYMYNDKDQLKEYDRYEKAERKYAVYYGLQDGIVTRGNQYKIESNGSVLTPIGNYRIEYDAEKRISKVTFYDSKNQLLSEAIRTFSSDGSNLRITTAGQNAGIIEYAFDSKKAWYSRINYNQIISIESLPGLLLSNTNNVSKISSSSTDGPARSFTYTYDAESFPTSWIETDAKGSKKTFKLTYK